MNKIFRSLIYKFRANLKARITLSFTLVLAVAIFFYGTVAFLFLDHELFEEVDKLLMDDLTLAMRSFQFEDDGRIGWSFNDVSSPKRIADHWTELWTEDGELMFRSNPFGERIKLAFSFPPQEEKVLLLKLPGGSLHDGLAGSLIFSRYSKDQESYFRVMVARIKIGEKFYIIRLLRSEADLRAELAELAVILLACSPFALFIAAIGGYFLTRRLLGPFKSLAEQAENISAVNLSKRLSVVNAHDEFGTLAGVFNNTFERLENSFRQMERFAEEASHALRTPLTCLRNVGELSLSRGRNCRKYSSCNQCDETIVSMMEEAGRLTSVTNALLVLARAQGQSTVTNRGKLELSEFLGDCREDLIALAEEKDQDIIVQRSDAIFVNVDPDMLRQAVVAILDNGLKYCPKGSQIVLSLKVENQWAIISISDDGPGISDDNKIHVFKRFSRLKLDDDKSPGFGLGLPLAKAVIERDGGKIELLDSTKGGACFVIRIPWSSQDETPPL
jgi:signal transduction histidine kinase